MRARSTLVLAALLAAAAPARGQAPAATAPLLAPLDALAGELDALYADLHRTPELSFREERTAARMAARLAALGFDVTTGVGGTGVVGVLGNGPGPTVMLRTDLDGLPVQERTGLLFASRATAVDPAGATVGVMHACGHDLHMTAWVGAATLLSRGRDRWSGTLVMVGQPAEERGSGARAMLADGLFTRFPRPDFALALHAMPSLP
ncbi:amidohydrolase, partial [Acidobacteria bacterium ACD]|nr:amidohydrolase [Acidobacteria bacterium ACD]